MTDSTPETRLLRSVEAATATFRMALMSEQAEPGTNPRAFAGRGDLWDIISRVRDAAPRTPKDASTDDIIDAIIDSGWLYARLAEERERVARKIDAMVDPYNDHAQGLAFHVARREAAKVVREGIA